MGHDGKASSLGIRGSSLAISSIVLINRLRASLLCVIPLFCLPGWYVAAGAKKSATKDPMVACSAITSAGEVASASSQWVLGQTPSTAEIDSAQCDHLVPTPAASAFALAAVSPPHMHKRKCETQCFESRLQTRSAGKRGCVDDKYHQILETTRSTIGCQDKNYNQHASLTEEANKALHALLVPELPRLPHNLLPDPHQVLPPQLPRPPPHPLPAVA